MKRIQWWFRIVSGFYILLAVVNFYSIFFDPQLLKVDIPFPVADAGFKITLDFWLTFVLDLLVIGAFLLWASRNPLKHLNLVWLVLWLEAIRGIVDDFYLIARGYSSLFYSGFTIIHTIIIITGFVFVRRISTQ